MNIINDDNCSFCHNEKETLIHLFYDCDVTQHFWEQLQVYINDRCHLNIQTWSQLDILFGSAHLDEVINKIILHAKYYIYYCRLKQLRPDIGTFKQQLCASYKIDKYMSKQSFKHNEFEKAWEKFNNLVSPL
jgi:hypothetical protein